MGRPAQISLILAAPILALLVTDARAQGSGLIKDPESGCATSNPFPRPNESIRWTGRCRDGKLSGPGVLIWYADGREYERDEGTFRNGELDGEATITFANGNRIFGTYRNGVRDGEFVIESPDGRLVQAVYREGAFVAEREMTAAQVTAFRAAHPRRQTAEAANQGKPLTTTLRTQPPAPPPPTPAAPPAPAPPAPAAALPIPPPSPAATPPAPPPAAAAPQAAQAAATPKPGRSIAAIAPQPRLRPAAPINRPQLRPRQPVVGGDLPFETVVIGGNVGRSVTATPDRRQQRLRLTRPDAPAAQRFSLSGVAPAADLRPVRPGAVPIGYGPARNEPLTPLQRPPTGQPIMVLTPADIAGSRPTPPVNLPRISLTPPTPAAKPAPATTRPVPAVAPAPGLRLGGRYNVDLRNSPIAEAAATIFKDLLRRPYRVAPGVSGTISLAPGRAIDAAELLSAFRQQLQANGADLQETADGYVIAPIVRLRS